VNLASRLEGLTKQYHQGIIISESLHERVKDKVPCRLLDLVTVKGKTRGVKIYGVQRALEAAEREAWQMNDAAMAAYQNRRFAEAAKMFEEVGRRLPGDYPSSQLKARSLQFVKEPPPAEWDGAEVMKTK